jgi:hypothetical protein
MLGHYGWVLAFGRVNHPLAEKRNGLVYISKQDIVYGQTLKAGDNVTFYLYVDGQGLGGEYCEMEQSADLQSTSNTSIQAASWQGSSREPQWMDGTTGVYYVPMGYMASTTPYAYAETGSTSTSASPQPGLHRNSLVISKEQYACTQIHDATSSSWDLPGSKGNDGGVVSTTLTKEEPGNLSAAGDEKLPSIGSVGHNDGSCKRCAFFPKGRCLNGADCTHCHFDHVSRPRARKLRPFHTGMPRKGSEMHEDQSMDQDSDEDSYSKSASTSVEAENEDDQIFDDHGTDVQPDSCPESELADEFIVDKQGNNTDPADDAKEACAMSDFDSSHAEVETTTPSMSVLSDDDDAKSSLAPTPTSWAESQRMRKANRSSSQGEASPTEVALMARGLLNKLTEDRFESICSQILSLPLSSQDQLAAVTAEIFGKATMQDGFRSLYVELCVRLDAHLVAKGGESGGKSFRKALVAECQRIFEKSLEPHDKALFEGLPSDECFELENKLKTGRLGNMRFIGNLMIRQLLAQKLMMPIVHELLNGDEQALEALIAFLYIVGPTFERKSSVYRAPLQDVFTTLRQKKNDRTRISPRVRFLITDLFDARKEWAAHEP